MALSHSVEYGRQVEYSFACLKQAYEYHPRPSIRAVFRVPRRREEAPVDSVRNDCDSVITDAVPGGYISCCRQRRCNDLVCGFEHVPEVERAEWYRKEIEGAPQPVQMVDESYQSHGGP